LLTLIAGVHRNEQIIYVYTYIICLYNILDIYIYVNGKIMFLIELIYSCKSKCLMCIYITYMMLNLITTLYLKYNFFIIDQIKCIENLYVIEFHQVLHNKKVCKQIKLVIIIIKYFNCNQSNAMF